MRAHRFSGVPPTAAGPSTAGRLGAAALALLLAIGLVLIPALAASAEEVSVSIGATLDPASVTVAPGTVVTWRNDDSERHRMRSTSGPEEFDSGNLESGESFSFTFNAEGTYAYVDDRDEDNSAYWGTVIVDADAGSGGGSEPPPPAGDAVVTIPGRSFQPSTVTIAAGGTVTWVNEDDDHTVSANDGSFDSGIFGLGQSYSRTFPSAGTYSYFCALHPDMVGTVIVEGDGTPAPTTTTTAPPSTTTTAPPPGSVGVSMVDFAFSPSDLTINAGDTVVWTNDGVALHTATANDGSFDSGLLSAGQTYSRTFSTAGTFPYVCTLHPEMTGTITVLGSGGEAPPPASTTTTTTTAPAPSTGSSGGSSVAVVDNAFQPANLTISVGGTVSWSNSGAAPHTVTAVDGSFDSGFLFTGDGYSRTFTQPGTYEYLCTIHPEMTGIITVVGAGAPGGTGQATVGATDGATASSSSGAPSVLIVDFDYEPRAITVGVGETVRWLNEGIAPHTVTARDGSFDSGIMNTGDEFTRSFAAAGTYEYICTLHPQMVATVVVLNADGTAPPAADAGEAPGATVLSAVAERADVDILDFSYDPTPVKVALGGTVGWVNRGVAPHTVTDRSGGFDSGILATDEGFEQTFSAAGRYEYYCTLHPNMVGIVEVVDPAAVASADASPAAAADPGTLVAASGPVDGFPVAGAIIVAIAVIGAGVAFAYYLGVHIARDLRRPT